MKSMLRHGGLGVALACLTTGVLLAQEPRPNPQTPPGTPHPPETSAQRADRQDRDHIVTAQGCLKAEKDVRGGKPNVAERAGLGEDFILTKAKLTKGGSGAGGRMYKIEGLSDEKLRAHLNQQVEVTGKLEMKTMTGATKPTHPGPDTAPDEVQEIEATMIKMLAATCGGGTN